MPDTLPKLSERDLARLRAVAAAERTPHHAWADEQPSTTAYLVTVGALRRFDAHTDAGELRQAVGLTPLGARVLAGQPGPEFDRFRALIARAETTEPVHVE